MISQAITPASARASRRIRPLVGLLLAGALGLACRTAPGDASSHWNVDSLGANAVKHFTGYRGPIDGTYVSYQAQKKRDINLTLRRHFLNNNPDNPFQVQDPSRSQIAPPHGLRPNPLGWFGAESFILGAVAMGTGAGFILIPLDSLLALTTSAGRGEFGESLTASFVGNDDSGWSPPPPSTFKVKNR